MERENWLNKLILDTDIIEHSSLSETEIFVIKGILEHCKSYGEIGREVRLSDERVRQLFVNAMGKILFAIKDLVAKNIWFQNSIKEKEALQKELKDLKHKFRKELAHENQLTLSFDEVQLPLSNIVLSVRAKRALADLKISTINQLKDLTTEKLNSVENVGVKTVNEILCRAEEMGIKIV